MVVATSLFITIESNEWIHFFFSRNDNVNIACHLTATKNQNADDAVSSK